MAAQSKQIINGCFFTDTPLSFICTISSVCLDAWTNKLFFKAFSLHGILFLKKVFPVIVLWNWCGVIDYMKNIMSSYCLMAVTNSALWCSYRRHALSGGITDWRCLVCSGLLINPAPGWHIQCIIWSKSGTHQFYLEMTVLCWTHTNLSEIAWVKHQEVEGILLRVKNFFKIL